MTGSIHRVNCLGTEPHMANCQVQVAPAKGKLQPACPGGMHAVVSCVAGPRFRPLKAKPRRKEAQAEVGLQGPAPRPGGTGPLSAGPYPVGGGRSSRQAGEEGGSTPIQEASVQTGRRTANHRMVESWNLFERNHL